MPEMKVPVTLPVTFKLWVTDVTPDVRHAYRALRSIGIDRDVANHVIAGYVMGTGDGQVIARRP